MLLPSNVQKHYFYLFQNRPQICQHKCLVLCTCLAFLQALESMFLCVAFDTNSKFTRSLHKKCWYSELFWSIFSRIRTEYGGLLHISPYSIQMQENMDQKNSGYRPFSHSGCDQNNRHFFLKKNFLDCDTAGVISITQSK